MIVDQTKTGRQNILQMVRSNASMKQYRDTDLVFSVPVAQSPATANGQKNTRLNITGRVPSRMPGTAIVNYDRLTLNTARPTAGNRIFINNTDTHASLLAKIVQQHRMVADQVVLTTQTRLPFGRGEELPFIVTPITNSLIYNPVPFTIRVRNNDRFIPRPSSEFFGASIATRGGLPVHTLSRTAFQSFANYIAPSIANFWKLMNFHQAFKHVFEITPKDGTTGALEIDNGNQVAANTYVRIDPRDNSVFTNSFYIFYCRFNHAAIRNMRSAPAKYKEPMSDAYVQYMLEYEGIPRDSVEIVSTSGGSGNTRQVNLRWLNQSYIGAGGNQTSSIVYNL